MSDLSKAERAENLLRDELFTNELNVLEQTQLDIILTSNEYDIDKRENAYRMIKALQLIRTHFESIAASKQIERKRWKIL